MIHKSTIGAIALVLSLVAGCARMPVLAPVDDPEAAARRQVALLSQTHEWSLDGRVSLTTATERWIFGIDWQEVEGSYEMRLLGSFGTGLARLRGEPHRVVLWLDDDESYEASDPDQLLALHTRQPLPISGLRFWVRGIPAPGSGYDWVLDEAGRITQLEQQGWQIRFRDFREDGGGRLPRKVFLQNGEVDVRIVIDHWQLTPGRPG